MFAEFGIVNFWTYLLGATLIVLAPGPETMFVIKQALRAASNEALLQYFPFS